MSAGSMTPSSDNLQQKMTNERGFKLRGQDVSRVINITWLLHKLINGLVSIETVAREMKRENLISSELTRVKLPP